MNRKVFWKCENIDKFTKNLPNFADIGKIIKNSIISEILRNAYQLIPDKSPAMFISFCVHCCLHIHWDSSNLHNWQMYEIYEISIGLKYLHRRTEVIKHQNQHLATTKPLSLITATISLPKSRQLSYRTKICAILRRSLFATIIKAEFTPIFIPEILRGLENRRIDSMCLRYCASVSISMLTTSKYFHFPYLYAFCEAFKTTNPIITIVPSRFIIRAGLYKIQFYRSNQSIAVRFRYSV